MGMMTVDVSPVCHVTGDKHCFCSVPGGAPKTPGDRCCFCKLDWFMGYRYATDPTPKDPEPEDDGSEENLFTDTYGL